MSNEGGESMFTSVLENLPMTDELASELFTNINADSFNGDVTFCATLRYLLFSKLQPNESVNVKLSINESGCSGFVTPFPLESDTIYISVMKGNSNDSFNHVKSELKHNSELYDYQRQASLYLTQKTGSKVNVYICTNTRTTLVFLQSLTIQGWHIIQASLTTLLPWYFPDSVSDSERAFLHTLTYKDSARYIECITNYAKNFNFHEDRLKRLLNGFGLSYEKIRLDILKKDQEKNMDDFNRAQEVIALCIAKSRDFTTSIMGIEELLAKGDGTGLADYFICNKCLHLISVQNEKLSYVVTTYFDYFNQTVFETFIKTPNSYFFKRASGLAKRPTEYKKLLNALFGDEPKLKVRTCAEFTLSLAGTLKCVKNSSHLTNFPNWFPHPHIDGSNCLGTNEHHINNMMMAKRYIDAIEQTVAAVKNINFSDSSIAEKLIHHLQTSKQNFIELPSGEVVNPTEAVKWLNTQEGC
jgi:hypothetical protein